MSDEREQNRKDLARQIASAYEAFRAAHELTLLGKKQYSELEWKLDYVVNSLRLQHSYLMSSNRTTPEAYNGTTSAMVTTGSVLRNGLDDLRKDAAPVLDELNRLATDSITAAWSGYSAVRPASIGTMEIMPAPRPHYDFGALVSLTQRVSEDASRMVQGSFEVLQSDTEDKYRQACHSLREALTHVIRILAPDAKLANAVWFQRAPDSKNGVTRRHRLIYVALGREADGEYPGPWEIQLVASTLELNDEIIANAHKLDAISVREVLPQIDAFVDSFARILELHLSRV